MTVDWASRTQGRVFGLLEPKTLPSLITTDMFEGRNTEASNIAPIAVELNARFLFESFRLAFTIRRICDGDEFKRIKKMRISPKRFIRRSCRR
jgi:hypothetical protein